MSPSEGAQGTALGDEVFVMYPDGRRSENPPPRRSSGSTLWVVVLLTIAGLVVAGMPASAADGQTKLTATEPEDGARFGRSVAVDGDTALVGAPLTDGAGSDRGAAHVFTRTDGTWAHQATLTADEPGDGALVGHAVALDGDVALVGAPSEDGDGTDRGAAYLFTRSDGTWTQQARLTADDAGDGDRFGVSVALDGDTALIGADKRGAAYVFTREGGGWSPQAKLTAADAGSGDLFGVSVALDGDTALIGALFHDGEGTNRGAAYVFTVRDGTWTQQAKLTADDADDRDQFGVSVALDGDTSVIGANYEDGSGTDRGAAYVFTRSDGLWVQRSKLTAEDGKDNDWFGISVAVEEGVVVTGALFHNGTGTAQGAAYVFTDGDGSWTQEEKLTADDAEDNDWFGSSAALDGGVALIGAPLEDGGGTDRGAAYVHTVNHAPTAGFTWEPDTLVAADEASFTDASADEDGEIVAWAWDFGDGSTSHREAPIHRFPEAGTYSVCLTVTDDLGAEATACQDVAVGNHPPLPGFTWSIEASPPSTLTFEDTTKDPDGRVQAWAWDFGDGDTSTTNNPTHTFPEDDTYEVCLTVTDDDGTNASLCQDVSVSNRPPTAGFTWEPEDPVATREVSFTGNATDEDGEIVAWAWDLGDGQTSSARNATHRFSEAGEHTVCLTATDDDGAPDRQCHDVVVAGVPPEAGFTWEPSDPHALAPVTFTDRSEDPDGTIEAWAWGFGDATTSSSQHTAHIYQTRGTYTVCLTATDDDGLSQTTCDDLVIASAQPRAGFRVDVAQVIAGEPASFQDTSTDPDGQIVSWAWDLGDGSTSTRQDPSHIYEEPGTYTVTLTVTDDAGETDTTATEVTVTDANRLLPSPAWLTFAALALGGLGYARVSGRGP